MAEAKIDFSSTDRNVLAFIQSISGGFDKLVAQQIKMEEASKKTAKTTEEGFGRMQSAVGGAVRDLASLATGWLSVNGAISLVASNIQRVEELNKRAASAAIGAAEGQRQTVMAFNPDATVPNVGALMGQAERIAKQQGVPVSKVFQVLPSALSAKGGLDNQSALTAAGTAMGLAPNAPAAEMNLLTGAAFDLMGATGGTAEQGIGSVIAGMQTSRVTSPAAYSQNVVGGIKQLVGMGYSLQEAIALTSAVSTGAGDATGSMSTTAGVQFGQQIKKNTNTLPGMQGAGLKARLDALQGTPDGQRIMAQLAGSLGSQVEAGTDTKSGTLTGEAKAYTSLLQILEGKGEGAGLFAGNLQKIPGIEGMDEVYTAKKAELAGLDLQQMARSEEKAAGAVESWKLKGRHKYSGQAAERFDQLLKDIPGTSWTENMSAKAAYMTDVHMMGENEAETGAAIFRQGATGMLFSGGEKSRTPDDLSQTERDKYDKLLEASQLMLDVAKMQRDNIMREQTTPTPNGPPPLTSGAK